MMVYDGARQEVVLFGGVDSGLFGDTWVWDGENWTQKFPVTSPPPKISSGMAYDAGRQELVLLGDVPGIPFLTDTWVWDGTNWTQKFPANQPGSTRSAIVYDQARKVMLFGGFVPFTGLTNHTWVWDGANWTQKFPATSPPPRDLHSMAYDAARGQVVLFGGRREFFPVELNDTWVWDGTNWTQKFPITSPPPRTGHSMTYDVTRSNVILFGGSGQDSVGDARNDTWVWDGTNWSQSFPATTPSGRQQSSIAYHPGRAETVLFGGLVEGIGPLDDTWVLRAPPAQFLTFLEGEPGISGDGMLIDAAGGQVNGNFELQTPFSLTGMNDGLTVSLFFPPGSGQLGSIQLNMAALGRTGVCGPSVASLGLGFPHAPEEQPQPGNIQSISFNGADGVGITIPQSEFESGVAVLNMHNPGCDFAVQELSVWSFSVLQPVLSPGVILNITLLDAAAFGLGQNAFP